MRGLFQETKDKFEVQLARNLFRRKIFFLGRKKKKKKKKKKRKERKKKSLKIVR